MPKVTELMTWVAASKRWLKMYQGKMYSISCRQLGLEKHERTRTASRQLANEWWTEKQKEIDVDPTEKLTLQDIEEEIDENDYQLRKGNIGEKQHRQTELNLRAKRRELLGGRVEELAYLVNRGLESPEALAQRLLVERALREEHAEEGEAIGDYIDRFVKQKRNKANADEIDPERYSAYRTQANFFGTWANRHEPVQSLNSRMMEEFHAHLLSLVAAKKMSPSYAKNTLDTAKQFARYCYMHDAIPIPKNIVDSKTLSITVPKTKSKTVSIGKVKELLAIENERLKLYILMMLNCGMYQSDISNLLREQVVAGRIVRKRSKTEFHENVPTVTYRLWNATARLLNKQGRTDGDLALTNRNGGRLRRSWIGDDGAVKKVCNISSMYKRLDIEGKPPLSTLRKTSANLLYNNEQYRSLSKLWLGHSPDSVQEIFYVTAGDNILDGAIQWLGEQYGVS